MNTSPRTLFFTFWTAVMLVSCQSSGPDKKKISQSYALLNSDSSRVLFPDDFQGNFLVVSFIYTHCPDVCPIITANLKNIQSKLQDTSEVQFIEISFDPERDTPSVLNKYKKLYRLNRQFSLLTGDTATVDSLLKQLDITASKVQPDSNRKAGASYTMKHSNTLYLLDKKGRIQHEYPASLVPPEHVVEDLNKLR